jgi:hypothetical protein
MHGILLMASAHLRYLFPESKFYSDAEAQHLASTIAGLRNALAIGISGENTDIVTACSLILLQHAWSIPYSSGTSSDLKTPVDIGSDNMLAFSAGLKSVLQSAWRVREKSIFKHIINPNMCDNLKEWSIVYSVSCKLEEFFQRKPMLAWPEFHDGQPECIEFDCDLVDALNRLTPVLRAADANCRGVDIAYLLSEISQYLILWPGKCNGTYRKCIQENDKEALLILLCFYLCTISLASKDYWWVRDRSKFMSEAISRHLSKGHIGYEAKTSLIYSYFGLESCLD